jgi:Protein phosphatase 2C
VSGSRWRAVGSSVRGDSHRRSGAPNQDALALVSGEGGGVTVAIADGHGSSISFRSDFGSATAVDVAVRVTRAFADTFTADVSRDDLLRRARKDLPVQIVEEWSAAVRRDMDERGFEDRELAPLREAGRADALDELRVNPLIAYGATLLVVAEVGRCLLILQLGDGDVVAAYEGDPAATARPLPPDPRLIGNETTSLCLPTATKDFRVEVIDGNQVAMPSLVVVTTDGYVNSFVDDAAFLQVGADLIRHRRDHGLDWIAEQLPGWLQKASKLGSGDDITMGVLARTNGVPGASSAADRANLPTVAPPAIASGPVSAVPARPGWVAPVIALASLVVGVGLGWLLFHSSTAAPAVAGSKTPSVATSAAPSVSPSSAPSAGQTARHWVWQGDGRFAEFVNGTATGRIVTVPSLRHAKVVDVTEGFGRLWLADRSGTITSLDARAPTKGPRSVQVSGVPQGLFVTSKAVIVSTTAPRAVWSVDPSTMSARRLKSSGGTATGGT